MVKDNTELLDLASGKLTEVLIRDKVHLVLLDFKKELAP
jgi:hypothetical protein